MASQATRYVIRSSGCGPFAGAICIAIGALILLSHYGYLSGRVTKWWPVLIIVLGFLLLIRHYWHQFRARQGHNQVIDPSIPISIPRTSSQSWRPPVFPIFIMGVGAYLLLRNFDMITLGVVLGFVLILMGLMFMTGNMRRSLKR